MKKLCLTIFSLGFCLVNVQCNSDSAKDLEKKKSLATDSLPKNPVSTFKWIEGKFELNSNQGKYREIWKKVNENEYEGMGYFFINIDTMFMMNMKLHKLANSIKIDYKVKGQNDGNVTEFILTNQNGNSFVFENPFRSFPSIMQYKLLGDTSISVLQRGFEDNKEKTREYTITRMKD